MLSNNPWGFIQSNVDEYLVFFYFNLNSSVATIQTSNLYTTDAFSFGPQDNFSVGEVIQMYPNGTYLSTLFDATSSTGLTNSQISFTYDASQSLNRVTRRIGDYFVASNSLYNDTVNNYT